ncbi:MAG: sulfite oxidase-like oxidoreductase [Pseudomonadota bacterium]
MNTMTSATGSILHISGRVTSALHLSMEQLRAMDILDMENLPMICGSGEPKGQVGKVRGVLLADIINRANVLVTDHNDTKKMYVVAASDDGYKAVFSWQEIFNSANGDSIIVLFEKDGRPLYDGSDEVDLLSARDHLSGPRYVKRLSSIKIVMVE